MKIKKFYKRRTTRKKFGFFSFLAFVAEIIAKFFKNGFIGFFFADLYTRCNEIWKRGFIYNLLKKRRNKVRKRATLAHKYDSSILSKNMSKRADFIIHTNIRSFGVAFLFFAFSIVGVAMLKYYVLNENFFDTLIIGVILVVLSLPLIVSKKELGEALLSKRLTRTIIVDILNLNPTRFERSEDSFEGSYLASIFFSLSLGALSYDLFTPLQIIGAVLIFLLFVLTMAFPELGLVFLMALLPFADVFTNPSLAVLVLVAFIICGYLFKLMRGKRVLRLELIDILVLVFSALLLFGGVFTFGGINSLYSAELYFAFILIYFMIVNMYIGKSSIYRAYKILIVCATIVSLIGIVRGGTMNASQVDLNKFANMIPRVDVFFDNPNMLGVYLVLVFPLALGQMKISTKKSSKIVCFMCAALIAVCTLMTGSRGAWLGIIFATALFLCVSNFKNIWLVVTSAVAFPVIGKLLPSLGAAINKLIPSFSDRFSSIWYGVITALGNTDAVDKIDSSISYRFSVWENVVEMVRDHLWGGIGVGNSAFKFVYDQYIDRSTEMVEHAHSLILQILLNLGIVGLAVFVFIMFTYLQNCFVEIKYCGKDNKSKIMIAAGLSSICGALMMGLTDYVWYNYRVFIMFWIVLALTISLARCNARERESMRITHNMTSVDVEFDC